MRVIKLSPNDVDMKTREMVDNYFQQTLRELRPQGQFLFTKGRISEKGIVRGELLVFSYRGDIVYLARAKTGRLTTQGQYAEQYPYYFCVDVDTIVPAEGHLRDLEEALARIGLFVNLVNTQAWPIIRVSDDRQERLLKIWESFIKKD